MGPASSPRAGRWQGREQLWNTLMQRDTLVADEHPHRSGSWRVFDPDRPGPITPMAILSDTDLHDLETTGVTVVYRHGRQR